MIDKWPFLKEKFAEEIMQVFRKKNYIYNFCLQSCKCSIEIIVIDTFSGGQNDTILLVLLESKT
jgi:hypothetical protein